MNTAPVEVIVIDSDTHEQHDGTSVSKTATHHEVIAIGSSEPPTSPGQIILTSPPQQNTTSRFSELFEEFRAKWGLKRDLVAIEDVAIKHDNSASSNSENVVDGPPAKKLKPKATRKGGPKTKLEALSAVELIVDERITLVDVSKFPVHMKVRRESLPFDNPAVIWQDGESGDLKGLIVIVLEMTDSFLQDHQSIIAQINRDTQSYSKRFLLLTNFKQFAMEHEKLVQKTFAKAVKEKKRFSGSAAVNFDQWHHQLALACLHHSICLFTVGSHGAMSASVEGYLLEWSKSVAWNTASVTRINNTGKPVKCGKDDHDTYRRMLEAVPRIPVAVVDALVRRFGSLFVLRKALIDGGPRALETITVNEQRTVGAAVSVKLHHLFTSNDLSGKFH